MELIGVLSGAITDNNLCMKVGYLKLGGNLTLTGIYGLLGGTKMEMRADGEGE